MNTIIPINFALQSLMLCVPGWILVRWVLRDARQRAWASVLTLGAASLMPLMLSVLPQRSAEPLTLSATLQHALAQQDAGWMPFPEIPLAAQPDLSPPAGTWHWQELVPAVPWAWLGGSVLLGLLHLACTVRASLWRRRLRPGPRHGVWTFEGSGSPCVAGIVRPVVAVSETANTGWTQDQWRWLLAHEREHVRGHDPAVAWLLGWVRACLWWNPLVHDLVSQWSQAREEVCDAVASAPADDGGRYAEFLVEVAARYPTCRALSMAASRPARRLRARLLALMNRRPVCERVGWQFTLGVVVVLGTGTFLASGAGFQVSAAPVAGTSKEEAVEPAHPPVQFTFKMVQFVFQLVEAPLLLNTDKAVLDAKAFDELKHNLEQTNDCEIFGSPSITTAMGHRVVVEAAKKERPDHPDEFVGLRIELHPELTDGPAIQVKSDVTIAQEVTEDGKSPGLLLNDEAPEVDWSKVKRRNRAGEIALKHGQTGVIHVGETKTGRFVTAFVTARTVLSSGQDTSGPDEVIPPALRATSVDSAEASTASPSSTANGIVAVVNQKVITRTEVAEAAAAVRQGIRMRHQQNPTQMQKEMAEADKTALDSLIERELVLAEFKRMGGTIKAQYVDEDVNAIIREQFKGDRGALATELAKSGMTLAKFRDLREKMMIVQVMRAKYGGKPPAPTPQEVEDYYKAHPEKWAGKEMLQISTISIPKTGREPGTSDSQQKLLAQEVRAKLEAGADFADLAKSHSQDSHAASGGKWDWMDRKTMSATVAGAAFALKEGEASPLIEDKTAYVIVRLHAKKPGPVPALDKVRSDIERMISAERSQGAIKQWLDGLRKNANIRKTP